MKVILLVIDGLPDLPIDGKTPLSEASKPNLDWFAAHGIVGRVELVPKGFEVWSHIANTSLLGYDPARFYLRRGPLEAVGIDLPCVEGHLALRCNFATVDEDGRVVDRRAGRNTFGLDELAKDIQEGVGIDAGFTFKRTYGHRAVLVIHERLSDGISDNDPHTTGSKPKQIRALAPEARRASKLVRDFVKGASSLLRDHPINSERVRRGIPPANYLLLRDAGNRVQAFPSFVRIWGIERALCIAEPGVMKATCMLAGFDALTVPEMGFEPTLAFVFEQIDHLLPDYRFIYAHLKGPDEPAHDGDFRRKRRMIEEIDSCLEGWKGWKGVLVVTSDHITSCELRRHVRGPVPVLVYGRGKDELRSFDEFAAQGGKLFASGKSLMSYALKK
jgi:2,3-bisphosphoglycerate-independent phosphoglycerate mutase